MIRITVHGIGRAKDLLRLGDMSGGFEKAGAIVEGAWKRRAHRVTGKYQGSIGHVVDGMSVRIGPQPGYGSPRKYTRGQTGAWQKPRDGTNRGDPRDYAVFEDQGTRYREGHPAAEPAIRENVDAVVDAIVDSIRGALR